MIFKVSNYTKYYSKKCVVKKFSFEFKPGLYLLTGRNGSGKSTTLKLLTDIIFPSNYTYQKNHIKMSFLCEHIELINVKVVEFLKLFTNLCNTKMNYKILMNEWKIPNKKMNSLSKGNKQKLGILMMLLSESDAYLFDEPTDALDVDSIKLFNNAIKDLLDKQKIVIIATHEKEYFSKLIYQEISFD